MGVSRQKRDTEDTLKLISFLIERNPFEDGNLRNIATGEVADEKVNVDQAQAMGEVILEKISGQLVYSYSFTKKGMPITMASKSSVNTGKNIVEIDPNLLLQRLAALSQQEVDKKDIFSYELCSFPASLFVSSVLPRLANKATLADYLWTLLENDDHNTCFDDQHVHFVIDGGALLHKLLWPKEETYSCLCILYCDYLKRKYGNPTIVFDGYISGASINDATHPRRNKKIARSILFQPEMRMAFKKDEFLANEGNKQRFIDLLSQHITKAGMDVFHAVADADSLIVKTAVELAQHKETCIIGDDTDLLIIAIDYVYKSKEINNLYILNEPRTTKKERIWPIQKLVATLGVVKCKHILFAHAFLGCDNLSFIRFRKTTSN